jgi:putative molybdopterin biosynthesis protein
MESTLLTAEDVAKQLRIKKYTVYELIKRGELPSSKVGKQVRVSQTDIDSYLRASKDALQNQNPASGQSASGKIVPEQTAAASPLIISGQDACLDLLVSRIAESGGAALRSFTGCYNSLIALYNGRVNMAASHLWDAETDTYNYPFIRRLLPGLPVGVFRLAGRMQGFYVKKGNPLNIRDWTDLARSDISIINRERGCGTRILLDQKLRLLGINAAAIRGYNRESTSHMVCANTVAKGGADLGCGCERGAESIAGAQFIPLQLEWYDFVFPLADRDTQAGKIITAYVTGNEFKQDLQSMGGYDISQTGVYKEF